MPLRSLILLALLSLAACDQPPPEQPAPEAAPADTPLAGPATKTDTLYIEGMPETMTLHRYDEPDLPFVTYLPEDMEAEASSSGEGTNVRFYAHFGDVPERDAYLSFFFPAGEVPIQSVEAMRDYVLQAMTRQGWRITSTTPGQGDPRCPWAEGSYFFEATQRTDNTTGYVCISQHAERPFYLTVHVPPAYGDGFGPRADVVLSEFRWRDTGSGLEEE